MVKPWAKYWIHAPSTALGTGFAGMTVSLIRFLSKKSDIMKIYQQTTDAPRDEVLYILSIRGVS